MKKNTRIRIVCLFVLLCLSSLQSSAATQRSLVLVSDAMSTVSYLSPVEIKKLFLNVPLEKAGMKLEPLRNASDPLITKVFLQNVIFMSERSYERKLLSKVFRHGGKGVHIYSDLSELKAALHRNPGAVTYMWADNVENDNRLKSLGVIWQGSN